MEPRPEGWLDIHGHFYLPRTPSEDEEMIKALNEAHFIVSTAPTFDAETVLAYNDRAEISMQMLSYLPPTTQTLQKANDFGLSLVGKFPSRFGLLAGLPTDKPQDALEEVRRMRPEGHEAVMRADGFAVTTVRGGIGLAHSSLQPLWEELNRRKEVIFVHPNAYVKGEDGRPSALIDVAFDTARTITDMIYNRIFLDFPDITWVFAHSGGAFPALSGRVTLLGAQPWVRNPSGVTKAEVREQARRIYLDTAATAETGMVPAANMAGIDHSVYGADCGVPCSTELTMEENRDAVKIIASRLSGDAEFVGRNGFSLFPAAKARAMSKFRPDTPRV